MSTVYDPMCCPGLHLGKTVPAMKPKQFFKQLHVDGWHQHTVEDGLDPGCHCSNQ